MFSCVFVTFPCGVLGQVWYLIVSIPDLCLLTYLYKLWFIIYTTFPWYWHVHDINTNSYPTIFRLTRHLWVVYISASVTGSHSTHSSAIWRKMSRLTCERKWCLNKGLLFPICLICPYPQYQCNLFICHNSFQKYLFCLKKRLHDQSGDKPKSHDCRKWNPYF